MSRSAATSEPLANRRNRVRGAIVLPINAPLYRNCMRAISRYASEGQRWEIGVFDSYDFDPAPLIDWKPDAMLVRVAEDQLPALRELNVPMVTFSMDEALPGVPNLAADDEQIGRIGAEHFLDRHFRHLAFLGVHRKWSDRRYEGFAHAAQLAGVARPGFHAIPGGVDQDALVNWLRALPKPTGLMVCHDDSAIRVLDTCAKFGIAVPRDVAVLGVDNFEYACDLTNPSLSSVINPLDAVVYEAFRTLERLHDGAQVPGVTVRIPSPGIVTRRSTDTTALQDADIALAMEVIRANFDHDLSVDDVAREAAMSRRRLEYRFRETLGRSPAEHIRYVRVERAKELLGRTRLPMPAIAAKCGFSSASQFATTFKQVAGQSPTAYRGRANQTPDIAAH